MYSQSSPRSSRTELHRAVSVGNAPNGVKQGRTLPHSNSSGHLRSPGRTRRRANSYSNQGSRSESPLTVDGAQDLAHVHSLHNPHMHTMLSPSPSMSPGRSPFPSPGHSRSSSMTSMKSLLRDRSVERAERETFAERHGPMVRDRSLDRQLDRHQRDHHNSVSNRDRTPEHDHYIPPHMGARSLDRDAILRNNLVRSRSIDQQYLTDQALYLPTSANDLRHARDTLLLELQAQVAGLNKECAILKNELELTREKLSSSMNSIKTFWSPELKKERVLRKEESARLMGLSEQLRLSQAENKVRLSLKFKS